MVMDAEGELFQLLDEHVTHYLYASSWRLTWPEERLQVCDRGGVYCDNPLAKFEPSAGFQADSMNDDSTKKMNVPEEDDWETADLSTFVKPSSAKAAPPSVPPNLRPSAPAFQPRASAASPSATEQPGTIRLAPRIRSNEGRSRTSPGAGQVDKGDDWFSSRPPVTNRQLWESGVSPNPTTYAQTSTSGSSASAAPAVRPAMQILRRPKDEPLARNAKSSGTATPPKTLEEKEEAYRIARERIFGPSSSSEPATPAAPAAGPSKSPIPHQIPTQIRPTPTNAYSSPGHARPNPTGAADSGNNHVPADTSGAWGAGGIGGGVRVGGGWVSSTALGGNLWAPPPAGVSATSQSAPRFSMGIDGRSMPGNGRQSPSNMGGIIRQPRGPGEFGSGFGA